ncbi:MAG: porin [Hylemonella sp.]|nr:porin [Hylemonella sp.]MDP1936492.1 porin [Hylemonella sp.]
MKKTLIALAALAATGAAFAQSSVTLYGRLDAGYQNLVANEAQNGVTAESRSIGGASNNLATSYWGIKGSEDLGGGLKANFNLEQGVSPATGATSTTAGAGFDRISTVGLSGDSWGSLNIGRFYTPYFLNQKSGDVNDAGGMTTWNLTGYNPTTVATPAQGTFGLITSIVGNTDVRANGIHYASPNFSGFNARVMLAPSDNTTSGTTTTGTNNNNGVSFGYANGPLTVGLSWGEIVIKNTVAVPVESKGTAQGLAGSYDFGVAKLFANWGKVKLQADTSVDTYNEKTESNVGVAAPFGKTTVSLAWGRNSLSQTQAGAELGSSSGNDWILGVQYDLSKRTALYAKTGVYQKYEGNRNAATYDTKTTTTAVGVRHLF